MSLYIFLILYNQGTGKSGSGTCRTFLLEILLQIVWQEHSYSHSNNSSSSSSSLGDGGRGMSSLNRGEHVHTTQLWSSQWLQQTSCTQILLQEAINCLVMCSSQSLLPLSAPHFHPEVQSCLLLKAIFPSERTCMTEKKLIGSMDYRIISSCLGDWMKQQKSFVKGIQPIFSLSKGWMKIKRKASRTG